MNTTTDSRACRPSAIRAGHAERFGMPERVTLQEAIKVAENIEPLITEGPVVMEVTRPEPGPARLRNGVERVDAFTVRCEGESFWQVFHQFYYGKPDFPIPD